MPPSLCRGRCIRYLEVRSRKKPYAVVLEVARGIVVLARGTSRLHPAEQLIAEVEPREKGSTAFRPPLNTITRFYAFDIHAVPLTSLIELELGGLCRVDIFELLATAMRAKIDPLDLGAPELDEPATDDDTPE